MLKANKTLVKVYKLILLFALCFQAVNSRSQGLRFCSDDTLVAQRTSYNVFKNDIPVFKDHLFVNFDLSLWDNENLGYVFNVEDKGNSYSLSYIYTNNAGYLNFNIDRQSNKLSIPLQNMHLKKGKWIKVKVDFDLVNDRVGIYINNNYYHASGFGFKNRIPGKLIFGKNQYYTEVPNMAVKNLYVGDNSSNYFFPLNEWEGNIVHSSNRESLGSVENPVWLINENYFWKPVYRYFLNDVAGLNFDAARQKLFVYKRDSLFTFDTKLKKGSSTAYKNELPVNMILGKSIFNSAENKCYIYEAYGITKGKTSIAALDMQNMKWQALGKATLPQQRHHHNMFYNAGQDSVFLFGGYGSFHYYNTFFKYDSTADKWENVAFKGDTINPRFFSATGRADNPNEVFLFGGYGNESGNQIVGGKQFYDLYRVNLKTHTIKRCWNIHPHDEVFVPANNLILSKDKKYFYVLCYPHELAKTMLRLYKFSVADGSYETVSAPIPVTSEKIETDINLFFNENADAFYCAIQEFTDPQKSVINIYSLSSPPVSTVSYLKSHVSPQKPVVLVYLAIALIIVLIIICGVIIFRKIKYKEPAIELLPEEPEPEENKDEPLADKAILEKKQNAAYLLGEFVVFNNNGKDITYLFSPKIKQLFILILLNSKNGNGVSSKKISHALWPDKDVAKTKNIKGVTFNHLRNIISDINGIELVFLNDTYYFKADDDFFCDYFFVSDLLKEEREGKNDLHLKYFNFISRGTFLSDMTDQWLDDFKQVYEDLLVKELLPKLQEFYEAKDYKYVLELAKLVLAIDPFNDNAFRYQLKSFKRIRGIEYAKKIYDHFTHEYIKSLDVEYHISFEKILQ